MKDAKPFIKWVGGKTQLLKDIEKSLPIDFRNMNNIIYIEPFVGGGAVLFWMLKNFDNISKAIINDINPDLTCAYKVIKEQPHELIEFLSAVEKNYFSFTEDVDRKDFFLQQRVIFNQRKSSAVERAGLFMFLNRTCFNGLYRVNKKGEFNVPFGKYANPKICDRPTILADSKLLQKVEILTGDFEQTFEYAEYGKTLFYFDPPYKPLTKTSSFTTYSKEDFNDMDQLRLGAFCKKVNQIGYDFLLSNSDLKNTDPKNEFFDELYSSFNIERVYASRMINSDSSKRGKVSEILVSNTSLNKQNYERAI